MKPLPIWDLVVASYSRVIKAFGYALRISGPWLVLLIVLTILAASLAGASSELIGNGMDAYMRSDVAIGYLLLTLLQVVVYALALASIAVLWHRMILLDETSDASFPFRVDRPVWLYIGYGLLIMLLIMVPSIVVFGAASGLAILGGPLVILAVALGVIIYVLVLIATLRLSIVLPAVAVGHEGFGLRDAWEATRGNGLRFLGASLLIALGMILIGAALGLVVGLIGVVTGGFVHVLTNIITVLVNVLGTLVGVSSLSLVYGYLVKDRAIER